jgi:hypothetical protein
MDFIDDSRYTRFIDNSTLPIDVNDKYVLTHCFDSTILRKVFPGRIIIKIKSDIYQSLRRRLKLENIDNVVDYIDSSFSWIVWQLEYYKKTVVDWDADILIDIDTDTSEFSKVMRLELARENLEFDIAWNAYQTYGKNAPIIDIAKSIYDK